MPMPRPHFLSRLFPRHRPAAFPAAGRRGPGGSRLPVAAGPHRRRNEGRKVRVAAVFLAQVRNSWPYPGFDAAGRQREILAALGQGCPEVEFVPVTIQTPGDNGQALALRDQVDGYLVYVATLSWALGGTLAAIGKLNKPMVVASEFLGGCGAFLTGVPRWSAAGVRSPCRQPAWKTWWRWPGSSPLCARPA